MYAQSDSKVGYKARFDKEGSFPLLQGKIMSNQEVLPTDKGCFTTKLSLLWMNLSDEPLLAIFRLMPFIMRKELDATTFQISLFAMMSPILSVASFYWGALITVRRNQLVLSLIGAWVLARIPFLFFPYINTFWTMFICCGIYHVFSKASTPALMEILKRNIPKQIREHLFSLYYVLSVLEGIGIGLLLTFGTAICDNNWRVLFLICALLSCTSVFVQLRIKIHSQTEEKGFFSVFKGKKIQPFKDSFLLLKTRPDFARFQWGFMIGGFALMLISPVRSIFAADLLPVTIIDVARVQFVFVGIGMAISSFLWKKGLERYGIDRITAFLLMGFGLFPVMLVLSSVHIAWFYIAHLAYGISQGGSHLVWHLSGTIFAKDHSSAPFTTVNVLMIGIRGLLGPALGGVLCYFFGPVAVLILSAIIGLVGGWVMLHWKENPVSIVNQEPIS